jgi:hypothetical protein
MDKFHDYLLSRQDRLDADQPDEHVWDRIETTLLKNKAAAPVSHLFRYLAAASVIILVAAGFWIARQQTVHSQKNEAIASPPAIKQDSAKKEMEDLKPLVNSRPVETPLEKEKPQPATAQQPIDKLSAGYAMMISSRLQQLRATPVYAECTEYFSDFTLQLNQMDKEEISIQKDIGHYGMQDALVEQLINIYERKLKLLKELQTQITRMNRKAGLRSNASKQPEPCFINL